MGAKVFGFGAERDKAEAMTQFVKDKIAERMLYRGEQSIRDARESGSYTDRTANLRNSIGYTCIEDGADVLSATVAGTDPVPSQEGGGDINGAIESCTERTDGLRPYSVKEGLSVIVVAGKEYATFVEAKGYDVISSTKRKTFKAFNDDVKKVIKEAARRWRS